MNPHIKKDFENHKAAFTTYVDQETGRKILNLVWGNPNSGFYFINYLIKANVLYVSGDCGEAVYHFSSPVFFEFFEDIYLDYFASKCEASPYGKGFKSFSSDFLKDQMNNLFEEVGEKLANRIKETNWENHTSNEHEWNCYLMDTLSDLVADLQDYKLNGKGVDIMCEYHLEGIKQALKSVR